MIPSSARLAPASSSTKSPDTVNALNQLEYLGAKIKECHDEIVTHQSQALKKAKEGGEFVARARLVWNKLRSNGQCKLRWEEWLLHNAGISRNTANNYKRIYVNFDKLEDLPPDQQSIAAAIAYLRTLQGGAPGRLSVRLQTVTLKYADLIAMTMKHNIQDGIAVTKLVAVINDVLKAAHISKVIRLHDVLEEL
jgi:hypothetical protein